MSRQQKVPIPGHTEHTNYHYWLKSIVSDHRKKASSGNWEALKKKKNPSWFSMGLVSWFYHILNVLSYVKCVTVKLSDVY